MVLEVKRVVMNAVTGRGLDGTPGSDDLQSLNLGFGYRCVFTL